MVKGAVFTQDEEDHFFEYFQQQVYFKNLPEVFEIVATDLFFSSKKVFDSTRQKFYKLFDNLWTEPAAAPNLA